MEARLAWLAVLALAACEPAASAIPSPRPPESPPAAPSIPVATGGSPSPAPSTGSDQRLERDLPAPVEEGGAAVAGGRLHVVGGFDAGGASSRRVYVLGSSGWTDGPLLPVGVDHVAAAAIGNVLYAAGGFASGPAVAGLWRLDGDRWTALAPMRHRRGALALVAAAGRLYALGGNDGAVQVAPAEEYDPASGAWTEFPPLPQPRNHVSGFAWQGMPCAAGGRSPASVRVDCLDPATRDWRPLPDLPQATSGAGAVAGATSALVAGGEDAGESAVVTRISILASGAWSQVPMLVPRHGFQPAVIQGRAWFCGGASQPGLHPLATCTSTSLN